MKQNMTQVLIKTKEDLLNDNNFESSETKKALDKSKEKQDNLDITNERIYTEMQQTYNKYIKGKANAGLLLDNLMNAYLGYYENQLYQNAEGRKLTSLSV